jgi:hypothetical protein
LFLKRKNFLIVKLKYLEAESDCYRTDYFAIRGTSPYNRLAILKADWQIYFNCMDRQSLRALNENPCPCIPGRAQRDETLINCLRVSGFFSL